MPVAEGTPRHIGCTALRDGVRRDSCRGWLGEPPRTFFGLSRRGCLSVAIFSRSLTLVWGAHIRKARQTGKTSLREARRGVGCVGHIHVVR